MNDTIKDCVQAYAAEHATEALFRLLRFDSNFLDTYSTTTKNSIQRIYKRFGKFEQFFVLREEFFFKILQAELVILPLIYFFNSIVASNTIFVINKEVSKIIYIFEFFIIMFPICILSINEKMKIHPVEIRHEWVNFSFEELDLKKCTACIELIDSRPIFHVTASWWLSVDKINQGIQEIGNIKDDKFININALNIFNNKTILQIEYELTNGERYVHLISKKTVKKGLCDDYIVYCERIYRKDKLKNKFVDIQSSIIHRFINN